MRTGRWFILMMSMLGAALAEPRAGASTMNGKPWFQGTYAEAQAQAKLAHKPLLLYWGAQWCPPCNELKAQVFSQPQFAELTTPLVAVAVDGDSDEAQALGAKLQIAGYPTVLLMSPAGEEWMRLSTSVNLEEFAAALHAGLSAGHSIKTALEHAKAGRATDDEWRMLAYYGGDELAALSASEALATYDLLVTQVPRALTKERTLLSAQLLAYVPSVAANQDGGKAAVDAVTAKLRRRLSDMLAAPAQVQQARSTLIFSGAEILTALYPSLGSEQEAADGLWLRSLEQLARTDALSVQLRLGVAAAPVQLFVLRHKDGKLPQVLRLSATAAVAQADKAAKTPYERHAVVADAAALLAQVGEVAAARELLQRELQHTDTPWYYQSAFAGLEEGAGNPQIALQWSAAARESVRGRASRLQWIVQDLLATSRLDKSQGADGRMSELVRAYYEAAFALTDGFQGRNATRAGKVAQVLRPWLGKPQIKALVKSYQHRCEQAGQKGCTEHFSSFL